MNDQLAIDATFSTAERFGGTTSEPAVAERSVPRTLGCAFDYSQVPPEVAEDARRVGHRIRALRQRVVADIMNIGTDLLRIKSALGHGHFRDWLADEFDMSERYATSCMAVAANLEGKTATVAALPIRELFSLAAKSTPPEVRQIVLERIEAGDVGAVDAIRRLTKARSERLRKLRADEKLTEKQKQGRAYREAKKQIRADAVSAELSEARRIRELRMQAAAAMIAEHMGRHLVHLIALLEQTDDFNLTRELRSLAEQSKSPLARRRKNLGDGAPPLPLFALLDDDTAAATLLVDHRNDGVTE